MSLSFNGDETKFWKNFFAKRQLALQGTKEVPCGTEGQEKDGLSTFLYTSGHGVKEDPFFILTGAVAPNCPQLATGAKRKTGTIRDKLERAIVAGRLDPRHQCWINKLGVMDTEAAMYLIECHGTTKPKNQTGIMCCHHF